jgi:hypothetical protein
LKILGDNAVKINLILNKDESWETFIKTASVFLLPKLFPTYKKNMFVYFSLGRLGRKETRLKA